MSVFRIFIKRKPIKPNIKPSCAETSLKKAGVLMERNVNTLMATMTSIATVVPRNQRTEQKNVNPFGTRVDVRMGKDVSSHITNQIEQIKHAFLYIFIYFNKGTHNRNQGLSQF